MESLPNDDKSFTYEEIIFYMKESIKSCEQAIIDGEVPVGCIFVYIPTKQIIISSHNLTNQTKNASAHCEINCINKLESILKSEDKKRNFFSSFKLNPDLFTSIKDIMKHCALFVSCEPCIMCAYALSLVKVKEVYYGCDNEKFGGNGSIMSLHKGPGVAYKSFGGYLKEEAIDVLRKFYSRGNEKAPEHKRQRKLVPNEK